MAKFSNPVAVLLAAGVIGAAIGVTSVSTTTPGRTPVASGAMSAPEVIIDTASTEARTIAVAAGVVRARAPQPGDHWGGCHAARAAGTAPIYRGEPGYREGMDRDGDGVACEPVPARAF